MPRAPWRKSGSERWGARLLLVLAWLACLAAALTEPVNRDEHMYLGAASLASEHRIYADFAFLQTPYSVWVYQLGSQVTPGDWILLPARLLKTLVAAAIIVVLFAVARRLGARPILAGGLVLLLFQNELVRRMAGLARNYDFAQLAILAALLLAPVRRDDPRGAGRLFLVGAVTTAAIGFKLTYAPLALLVLAWPVLAGAVRDGRGLFALAAGAATGLIPLAISLVGVDPAAVRFNLLDYHFLNAEFHVQEGYEPHATLLGRAARGLGITLAADHRPLVGMALAAAILGLAPWPSPRARRPGAPVAFAVAFLAAAALMGVLPRPLQTYYLAPVFFGLVLLVAALAERMASSAVRSLVILCVVLIAVDVSIQGTAALRVATTAIRPAEWTAVRVHRSGRELAAASSGEGPVATTHPIDALEAGLDIYPELGTGEFVWRSGSMLSAAQRRRFRVACAADLDSLLRAKPPGLVLVEEGARWDDPLAAWAENAGWRPGSTADSALRYWSP